MTLCVPSRATAGHPWCAVLDREFSARQVALGDGIEVTVREAGPRDAPPVVLLHGIGSGSASWLPVVRHLASQARVLAWDAPGYGDSTPLPEAEPTTAAYAHRLARLLDALDWPRTVLVGHSLGGLMAGTFATLHPGRLHRLVLLCPASGYGAPGLQAQAQRVRHERLGTLDSMGVQGMARERGPRLVRGATDELTRGWAVWNMSRLHPPGYRQAVELLCGGDLAACAPLSTPVEVHVGDEDTVTPPDRVAALAAAFGVRSATIPESGHLCTLDQPQAVARIVLAALQTGLQAARCPEPAGPADQAVAEIQP